MHLLIQKNNQLSINRGDYFSFPLKLQRGKFPYVEKISLSKGDLLYFGIMRNNDPFERSFIKREFSYEDVDSSGNITVTLLPEDTIELDPGYYYYEVKLLCSDMSISTVVQKTKLYID